MQTDNDEFGCRREQPKPSQCAGAIAEGQPSL
jgi:hypothetical protein